jgi:metallo-beta-lactamase class B
LHDGDEVKLGKATLIARLTAGHTKGCTTWTMKVADGDKVLNAVIIGSPNVNAGYKLVRNEAYPSIASDYEQSFSVFKSLPCDIFLGAHGDYFNMEAKYAKLKQSSGDSSASGSSVWIDPDGYKRYVAEREQAFRNELARQIGQLPK